MNRTNVNTRTTLNLGALLAAVLAASLVFPALAASENKLDARVRDLTDYFEKVQKDAGNAAPAEILSKAEGLVIMRSYKAGLIVGVAGGGGVAIVKNKTTGKWGPVGFLKSGEGRKPVRGRGAAAEQGDACRFRAQRAPHEQSPADGSIHVTLSLASQLKPT